MCGSFDGTFALDSHGLHSVPLRNISNCLNRDSCDAILNIQVDELTMTLNEIVFLEFYGVGLVKAPVSYLNPPPFPYPFKTPIL
jgi:hypothetical protein